MGISDCPCGGFIPLGPDATNRCDVCGRGPFEQVPVQGPSPILTDYQVLTEVAELLHGHTRSPDMATYNHKSNLIVRLAIIADHLAQNPRK